MSLLILGVLLRCLPKRGPRMPAGLEMALSHVKLPGGAGIAFSSSFILPMGSLNANMPLRSF